MADRHQILDVLADYGWGNDAKDEAVLNSVFADDARLVFSIVGGDAPVGVFEGRKAIVEFLYSAVTAQTEQRRHVIPNVRFLEETAETAKVRAYLILNVIDGARIEAETTGVYHIDFGLRDGTWKVASMELVLDAAL